MAKLKDLRHLEEDLDMRDTQTNAYDFEIVTIFILFVCMLALAIKAML